MELDQPKPGTSREAKAAVAREVGWILNEKYLDETKFGNKYRYVYSFLKLSGSHPSSQASFRLLFFLFSQTRGPH